MIHTPLLPKYNINTDLPIMYREMKDVYPKIDIFPIPCPVLDEHTIPGDTEIACGEIYFSKQKCFFRT